jgi:two-component system response regulator DesR
MRAQTIVIGSDSLRRTREIHDFVFRAQSGDRIIVAHSGDDFFNAVQSHQPRLVFLETSCWFELTAYEIAGYAEKYPHMRVAVFCNERMTPAKAAGFITLGAESFVDMRIESEAEIAAAIKTIVQKKIYMPEWVSCALEKYRHVVPEYTLLQQREFSILRLLALGNTVQDIALKMNIAHGTVRNHILSIHRKTGVHRQVELLSVALKLRAVNPDELIAAEFAVIDYY